MRILKHQHRMPSYHACIALSKAVEFHLRWSDLPNKPTLSVKLTHPTTKLRAALDYQYVLVELCAAPETVLGNLILHRPQVPPFRRRTIQQALIETTRAVLGTY
jgi:hypothetical protein